MRQIKAARALLAWSQEKLADMSGVSIPTIKRLEADDGELGGRTETRAKIIAAIEGAGVSFTVEGEPGVIMMGLRNSYLPSLPTSFLERDLSRAIQRIERAHQLVARQRALIDQLRASRLETADAEATLVSLEISTTLFENYLSQLREVSPSPGECWVN
jgi:transcriptional regulator with XRE-family HTH domain